ncbi:two-component system sensor histidine kinase KdpD [Metallibacterium sp.]|uniref:two-component system sensor histidine kinase KdpD n=1 Tax=Metallibacterium sp. TaxID=2940281 RepID=UPI00262E31E9|nr:two-component system sensor histidine kinase KdpD [Metallibacterium sp.]
MTEENRPEPDALQQQVEQEALREKRGKLKIFFGASPGVGKTYAMLTAAHRLREQAVDVACGVVETHGRDETAKLLVGLECLPQSQIGSGERTIREFDLAGALQRRPNFLLVDELAHSNAPGSRHPKRWQDVEELLAAGINVYTTLNVQHLDSVSHIVASITGVKVRETVPDRLFNMADDVVLVDLPADELLQRLKEGKVYLPAQAARAIHNFFRKGNLLALRQLALRLTAERVDSQMRSYRSTEVGGAVWGASEALLVCIGPDNGQGLVRAAARLVEALHARWYVVYVETPTLAKLAESRRSSILKVLQFARDLGAHTAVLSGPEPAAVVHEYARTHNLNRVLLGRRQPRPWWRDIRHVSLARTLDRVAPDIDLILIAPNAQSEAPLPHGGVSVAERSPLAWRKYLWALAICAAVTVLASPLRIYFDLSNIVMFFLLGVVLVALRLGRGPAALAAVASVLAFDFFYVPPRFSFAISDVQYLFTFSVMLGVGLVIGHLTANLRYQLKVASQRERRTHDLYSLSRDISSALTAEKVVEIGLRYIRNSFRASAELLLLSADEKLYPVKGGGNSVAQYDIDVARWCLDHGEAAGIGTDTLPALPLLYLPLKAPMRTRGVLVLAPGNPRLVLIPEQRRLLDTFTTQIAIALERQHFVAVAQDTLLAMEAERLRNSVLSALSHDLRTPLTALIGDAELLKLQIGKESTAWSKQSSAIAQQARRIARMVDDMLEMARLQSGRVNLRKDWQSIEELVGSALRAVDQEQLAQHPLDIDVPADLPLVQADAGLLERVFINLIDNALKYTVPGTRLGVSARVAEKTMRISVWDAGPGMPAGREEMLFDKFARGNAESTIPGVGLGLAICRAIVEAHGGSIRAGNRPQGGAVFTFELPLHPVPLFSPEIDDDAPHGEP